ncbi:MAG TPA: ATP-dependent metallopeptidase FtsH/Yme1/Tma family protein, partial [Candidatus Eisenbacteria bacterium]
MSFLRRDSGPDSDSGRDRENRPRGSRGGPSRRPAAPNGRPFRTLGFWVLVVLLSLVAYRMYQGGFVAPQRVEISYTRFIHEVDRGNILNLQILENTVTGELKAESSVRIGNRDIAFKTFRTNVLAGPMGPDANLPDRVWKTNPGIEIEVHNAGINWVSVLFTWLPLIIFFGAWMFFIRQMQSGGSAALKF